MNIIRITEFFNMHRLIVWYDALDNGWRWRVSVRDVDDYYRISGDDEAQPVEDALRDGRKELAAWSKVSARTKAKI